MVMLSKTSHLGWSSTCRLKHTQSHKLVSECASKSCGDNSAGTGALSEWTSLCGEIFAGAEISRFHQHLQQQRFDGDHWLLGKYTRVVTANCHWSHDLQPHENDTARPVLLMKSLFIRFNSSSDVATLSTRNGNAHCAKICLSSLVHTNYLLCIRFSSRILALMHYCWHHKIDCWHNVWLCSMRQV